MVSSKLSSGDKVFLVTVYRLDYISTSIFYQEFTQLLEELCVMKENFIMSGDINFHLETMDANVVTLKNIFESFNLVQHVNLPTHSKGHTLDFILCRDDLPKISSLKVEDVNLSDHFLISFTANCTAAKTEYKTSTCRNIKSIDIEKFKADVLNSLTGSNFTSFGDKISFYNDNLKSLLDSYAPLKTKSVKIVPHAPWFDLEYRELRKRRRKAERKYMKTRSSSDKKEFSTLRKMTTNLAFRKKREFFSDKIQNCSSSKALFSCVNRLMDNTKSDALPTHESPAELASKFNKFFKEKIINIRKHFPPPSDGDKSKSKTFTGIPLSVFRPATLEEIEGIVGKFGLKSSPEDPLPASLLVQLKDILIPVWLELVNLSLEQGSIECLKSAVVLPLLKGLDSLLDTEIFKNYRPVSNLQLIGKIIERIIGTRLDEHMDINQLHCNNQYGYKKNHSTELLLLKIANDLLLSCDRKIPTLVMLLDLSAAFDTVDQDKMLAILENNFGITGTALNWFKSFLKGRTQKVCVNNTFSEDAYLDFGVPQGSILGPKLFNIYAQSFSSNLNAKVDVSVEGYADDHQVQKQFGVLFQFQFLSRGIENIYNAAEVWMFEFFLMINCSKTLLMIVAPPSVMEQILIKGSFINGCCIRFVSEAKNLGVILDSFLSFDTQVKKVVRGCFNTLRKISRIKKFLTYDDLKLLACALVLSHIDYCNVLYYHISSHNIRMLQSVQNSAARLVSGVNRFDQIDNDNLFQKLHWLKITERIEYKILTIVHKCLYGNAPSDLSSLLLPSQSDRTKMLNIPVHHTKYGERSFSVSGPRLWNTLPYSLRIIDNFITFKKYLKTFLFKKCFNIV